MFWESALDKFVVGSHMVEKCVLLEKLSEGRDIFSCWDSDQVCDKEKNCEVQNCLL